MAASSVSCGDPADPLDLGSQPDALTESVATQESTVHNGKVPEIETDGPLPRLPGHDQPTTSSAPRCNEAPSPAELTVQWVDAGGTETRTELVAVIHNGSASALEAEPVVMVANSTLGGRELVLGKVMVEAGEDRRISLQVTDLPLQTGGIASAVTLGVRWQRSDLPGRPMMVPNALSDVRHLTHDSGADFRAAVVRSNDDQFSHEAAERSEGRRPQVTEARVIDPATGLLSARVAEEIADLPIVEVETFAASEQVFGVPLQPKRSGAASEVQP